MSSTVLDTQDTETEVAFKALPVDPARQRRTTGSFEDDVDELSSAGNCKEATLRIVNAIVEACKNAGVTTEELLKEGDIVRSVHDFYFL